MPWGKVDDGLYDHPKADAASLAALGVHLLAISFCNRHLTDGYIPRVSLPRIRATAKLVDELVSVGLWDEADDGYAIHDFLEYNESKATILERRAALRELGKRGGSASGEARRLKRDGSSGTVEHPSRPLPSRPLEREKEKEHRSLPPWEPPPYDAERRRLAGLELDHVDGKHDLVQDDDCPRCERLTVSLS